MADKDWVVTIGRHHGTIAAPDWVEAATRFLERLDNGDEKYGVGILIRVEDPVTGKSDTIRSDLILANAGMYDCAAAVQKLYQKNEPPS